jgi:tetratricopeptide (TPR) repeat protein
VGVVADLARLAFAAGRFPDAEAHLRRALAMPAPRPDEPAARGARAELLFDLAHALVRAQRPEEALHEARRAYDLGRGSGTADGRSAASMAALMIADLSDLPVDERRRLYVAAADLGRLSHTEQGRKVSEVVARRLAALEE